MSFSFHSDVQDHPVFSKLSNGAFGLWVQAGTWTSAHGSPGVIPDHALEEIGGGEEAATAVDELVAAGVWTHVEAGYRMEYGPSADFPLPVWRYDDSPPAGGLIEVVPEPDH